MALSPATHLDLDARVLFGGVLLLGLLLALLAIPRQRHGRPPLHDQLALPARHQLREDLPEVQGHALHATASGICDSRVACQAQCSRTGVILSAASLPQHPVPAAPGPASARTASCFVPCTRFERFWPSCTLGASLLTESLHLRRSAVQAVPRLRREGVSRNGTAP